MKHIPTKVVIPAMLDAHFDLLQYAFSSSRMEMTVLKNRQDVVRTGLSYGHNDLCYPAILIIGQLITAVQRRILDPAESVFLIPQAGDACRGSNYLYLIRTALKRAGISMPVISLNFVEQKEQIQFHLTPFMLWKALAAVLYSDMLLLLYNQVKPYEIAIGASDTLYQKWIYRLQTDLKEKKHLHPQAIRRNFKTIAEDFASIKRFKRNCPKIGIVGELYIKYCALGNHDLVKYLREQGAEPMVNGFSWYALYYINTHLTELSMVNPVMAAAYRAAGAYIERMQRQMVQAIREKGFVCFDAFSGFAQTARQSFSSRCSVGDGWLIGGEICNFAKHGYHRIACVQPFGCMANQVCGKGIYSSLQRKLPHVRLVSLDYDASGSDIQVQNRAAMLLF